MAEDDPFAKYATQPAAEDDPFAKFAEKPQPGIVEDAVKAIGPSLVKGSLATITAPRMVSDLTGRGVNWLANKVAPQSVADAVSKFHNMDTGAGNFAFPAYDDLKARTEKITGPLYEPQRWLGKGLGAGLEVGTGLLAGGEGAIPTLLKAGGSAIGSTALGETASALKDYLPTWAEPVARGVGGLVGLGIPAAGRKLLTPKPITDPEHAATIAGLRATNPEFLDKATAGQFTNDQKLLTSEGRTSKFANQPAVQEDALTREAMKTAGAPDSLATPETLKNLGGKNKNVTGLGEEIGNIRRANEINPTEFPVLKTELANIRKGFAGTVGKGNAQALADVEKEIALGAQNSPANASMRGPRYEYMRQILQSKIDSGATGTDKTALADFRDALDRAFHRSVTPQESSRLKELEQQYTNFKAIAERSNVKGKTTLSPAELRQAAQSHFGNVAANMNTDKLSALSDNAAKVMQELPKRSIEAPEWTPLAGSLWGAMTHGGSAAGAAYGLSGRMLPALAAGITGAGEGSISGLLQAPHVVNVAKDMAARLRATSGAQKYYKNQMFLPGNPAVTNDPATLARLLMTPQAERLVDQSK